MKTLQSLLFASALVMAAATGSAASLTLKVVDKEPPKELDASIATKLQKTAVQLLLRILVRRRTATDRQASLSGQGAGRSQAGNLARRGVDSESPSRLP